MAKKAMEVSPPSLVVVIVLGLIVLLVLLFIFGGTSKNFFSFISDLWGQGKGETCQSPFLMRYCSDQVCPNGYSARDYPLPPGKKEWTDCPSGCIECIKSD